LAVCQPFAGLPPLLPTRKRGQKGLCPLSRSRKEARSHTGTLDGLGGELTCITIKDEYGLCERTRATARALLAP